MRLFKFMAIPGFIGILLVSCAERQTSVVIKQGPPHQFIVSGHGLIDVFTINGPTPSGGAAEYWVIAPIKDFDVTELTGPIVYGQLPAGFRQVTPAQGSPPPIGNGQNYSVALHIRNGSGINMLFAVRDGKIITEADGD